MHYSLVLSFRFTDCNRPWSGPRDCDRGHSLSPCLIVVQKVRCQCYGITYFIVKQSTRAVRPSLGPIK